MRQEDNPRERRQKKTDIVHKNTGAQSECPH
jgi:hypothetical protein